MNRFNEFVITVVNLKDGSVEILETTPELGSLKGGAAVNTFLLEKYRDQAPLALGTGALTGGFAPASSLMIASFIKPGRGPCHVPVVIRSGPLLKFSGTDYLLLLGRAPSPVLVSIKKGRVELKEDPFADDNNFFSIAEKCRMIFYEEPILLTNPNFSPDDDDHGACTSVFGGFDRCGLSGFMASKNIKAVLPGGGRGVAYDKADMEKSIHLTKVIKRHLPRNRSLLVLNAMADIEPAKSLVKMHLKQSHACFHCPVACISYLSIKQGQKWLGNNRTDGLFVMDYEGFAALARKRPVHAHLFMAQAQALGINPQALADSVPEQEAPGSLLAEMETIPLNSQQQNHCGDPFEEQVSPDCYYRFGNALPKKIFKETVPLGSWEERVAFAMITGVCPIPLIVIPGLSPLDFLPFLTRDKKDEKMLLNALKHDIQMILTSQLKSLQSSVSKTHGTI